MVNNGFSQLFTKFWLRNRSNPKKSFENNGPYDTILTEGDPYEREDLVSVLELGGAFISIEPLTGGIGGGEIILRPGDTTSVTMQPEKIYKWYANAPIGMDLAQHVERVPNSGGHHHGGADRSEVAAGRLTPSYIQFQSPWPQNTPSVYLSPDVCGRIVQTVKFSGEKDINIFYDVRISGLVEIQRSTSLRLKPPTNEHPSFYWATPAFANKLQILANRYYSATGDAITLTDGCLEWGGRFDLRLNWRAPHAEHFFGNTADIRSFDITDPTAFQSAASAAGITVLERFSTVMNRWGIPAGRDF